jgi:hypothetical protein
MAIETHPAFTSGGSSPGARWRAGLAVLGGLVVLAALVTLGYTLGSLMNHAHHASSPRQAGSLAHASARAHPGRHR